MPRVTGIGGIFFKADDVDALREWYREKLGFDVQEWGGTQFYFDRDDAPGAGYAVWSPFPADTKYFEPSDRPFMVNLRVDDLDGLLAELREAGARVLDRYEASEFGKFGYVVDPEGNLLELWEQAGEKPAASGAES